ncbi:helix-turn-helix transcriptional regulator [Thermophilibacter sp.]|uniref:helix-turn-helix transcriptional regulator n=1 Tax=Thermophilibacter sp. TaxID=2847309 RepID=UPI003A8D4D1B
MELGSHIKARRAELGISQDELAGRIYVSRQTISSWENDKTYPDVQSLLLLSQVFGTTIDELVRGDVDTMKETVEKDVQLLKRLSYAMTGFIALMVLAMIWWVAQMTVWDLSIVQTLPTAALALVLWGIALFAERWAKRIKREHDLVTYQEVLAFWNGEPVDRDTERGRRERLIPRWMKVVRIVGWALFGMAVGFFIGYGVAWLTETLIR